MSRGGVLFLVLSLVAHTACSRPRFNEATLRTGDLVFQTSGSRQSLAIQLATNSPLSHVGLVEVTASGTYVVEAVQPVRRIRFTRWKTRGVGERLLVLRPRLSEAQRAAAVSEARRHLGKPYDTRFGWGDEAMYCSELVRKAYSAAAGVDYGQLQRLGSLHLERLEPALSQRYSGRVPLELELITPASLAADERLGVVYSDFPSVRGGAK